MYNVDLLILNSFDMTVFCGWLSYWMVVNSWLISGVLMSMLRKSCHSTYLGSWSHIKQSCSSFWLGLKYTKQNPPSLLCEFLCPRATDFLPNNYYVPSLIVLDLFWFELWNQKNSIGGNAWNLLLKTQLSFQDYLETEF